MIYVNGVNPCIDLIMQISANGLNSGLFQADEQIK